ncbi:MAG: serine--tRNA ligase [Flavobacteriales bacterium]|nr:serine--tRNA ligase [Flavobacteriales bacterium]MCB9190804.1 serine--tRNA ligase [Flavobacteriales bacterium]
MLQTAYIKENRNEVIERLKARGFDATESIDSVLALDEKRRATQTQLDETLAEANKLAKEIGGLFKQGKAQEANDAKAKAADLKQKSSVLQDQMAEVQNELNELLYHLPNIPHQSVPAGKSDQDNEVVSEHGAKPTFDFTPKPHWDLVRELNLIDFELGAKITGAGFPLYVGKGAQLQRALINFFLDEARAAGYTEFIPPFVVNEASGFGTGQLPDKEGQMYHMKDDNLYMIPTAEVPLTNIFRDVILNEDELPKKLTAYSPCFRREAGSYGKDVKGLNRLHQFDKVEIVQVVHPDKSYEVLDTMVAHAAGLLDKLGLHYRILRLCGGDLGFTSALTFDFEVWSGGQERWLEVSSVSNFETFQTNRLKLRYRQGNDKPQLAHTLNGSALALPRIMAALIENNQAENGIRIPAVLHKYTGFESIELNA